MAGVVIPLSAIRTRRDWGIGQVTDLPRCAEWIRTAGHSLLQILPAHELAEGETSPYGALTAFGIDPIYADVEAIEDLDGPAIANALGDDGARELERVRLSPQVDYRGVRALKTRVLHAAFERFREREWTRGTERAKRLERFVRAEDGWLDDLALYGALRRSHGGWGWTTWPDEERDRTDSAIARVRKEDAATLLEIAYVAWILEDQWQAAHAAMREAGVELMGDLPFIVGAESADAWSHAAQFQLRVSLGAPPDAYSADGQDWGLPAYDWLAMEADGMAWVRARVRRAAALYDRFRMDHVVGYFRQWVRLPGGVDRGRFDPEGEDAQRSRGRRVLGAMLAEVARAPGDVEGSRVIAEDLGVIPPFVRQTLQDRALPGYRVLPWEKDDGGFRDPKAFPRASVASWSTHDTAPIDGWWPDLPPGDRAALVKLAAIPAGVAEGPDDGRRSLALLAYLYGASSDLALVLAQELLGLHDRINTPGTVGPQNWTWRLPRSIEELTADPHVAGRMASIRKLVQASGR